MNVKETLISLGYEKAEVELENDLLNQVEDYSYGKKLSDKIKGVYYKFVTLLKYKPRVVLGGFDANDDIELSHNFWKIGEDDGVIRKGEITAHDLNPEVMEKRVGTVEEFILNQKGNVEEVLKGFKNWEADLLNNRDKYSGYKLYDLRVVLKTCHNE